MADEQVITELVIDARPAEAGSAAYVKAMKAAEAAQAKVVGQQDAVTKAIEKQTAVLTQTATSLTSTSKAWDRLKASVDPAFAATQRMERALLTADAAAKKLGIDQVEINRVMDLAKAKHLATAVAVEEGAQAARLGATQWASLGHSVRSAAESIAIGASPMQALTQQANHLSYAMSGPQGIIAASAGVRAAFGAWITTIPGLLTGAGVAAVAAVGAYMLATREDIKSADEVLKNHKALIDEIAKAYPAAAAAAKKYEDQAAKMPNSVIAANIGDQVTEAKKTLLAQQADIAAQIRLATTNPLTGDRGDFSNFGDQAYATLRQIEGGLDGTAAGALRAQSELGKLRIDPSVPKDAHDFASSLQDAANKAVEVAATIKADSTVKDIVVDGHKAVQTLADVAAGFKDTGSKAGAADATIAKLFGTVNAGGGDGFGVSKAGSSFDGLLGQFAQADQAIQEMRRNQVASMLDLTKQFRDTTEQVDVLKKAISTAAGKDNVDAFFKDVSNIKNANSELQNSVDTVNKLYDALNSGNATANTVASGLDMIRQTLVNDGFGVDEVNKFIDSLIRARAEMDAGSAHAQQLDRSIQAIKNRTVTITVVTQQVGSGTKSIYDVGSTGGIGVTRYGGTSNMTQQAYSVPGTGYGSQGGYGNGGTSTVGVTRFSSTDRQTSSTPIFNTSTNSWGYVQPSSYQDPALLARANAMYPQRAVGGPVSANTPYWVGERGPELVMPQNAGTVVPHAQSLALAQSLADPQSQDTDKLVNAITSTEVNTKKTAQILDDIKTSAASASSALGGSSSGGLPVSSAGTTDPQAAAYMKALATARANFRAAGIVGAGITGYGTQGLNATPEQIAHRAVYGFSTGGMMGPGNGDTQQVQFFKRPSEHVIIADDDQLDDRRGSRSGGGDTPIQFSQTNNWKGNAPPSQESLAAVRRATALGLQDALRSVNGR